MLEKHKTTLISVKPLSYDYHPLSFTEINTAKWTHSLQCPDTDGVLWDVLNFLTQNSSTSEPVRQQQIYTELSTGHMCC